MPWGVDCDARVLAPRARRPALRGAARRSAATGVADLVDRCCDHAQRIAARLAADDGVEILNDVVLNQVLVRFGDDDAVTNAVIERVQQRRHLLGRRQPLARRGP